MNALKKAGVFFFWLLIGTFGLAQDIGRLKQAESSVHGSVSMVGTGYGTTGIYQRRDPFSVVLTGNLTVDVKGLVFPFSFVYSDRTSSFRQPFNQFGLSPHYKWITAHMGFRNVNFSKYVLGGHTFLGGGLELNPGIFRFGIVYGRLQKATDRAFSIYSPLSDTIQAFNRKMISMKVGVGNRDNFFDVIVLRAYDDTSSVDWDRDNSYEAASNLVGGINSRLKISKSLHMEVEGAYSIYTYNQRLESISELEQFNSIIPINLSTQGALAFRSSLVYQQDKGTSLAFNYNRIDPGYQSMGTYYLNNDLENYTLSAGFRLLGQKLLVKAQGGLERNNLNTSKNSTTKKAIGSANISYNPGRFWGVNVSYSNFSVQQRRGRIQIADSIKIYQVNSTLLIQPHFQFRGKGGNSNHFITIPYTRMRLNDKNSRTAGISNFTSDNAMLNYTVGFSSGWSVTCSAVYTITSFAVGDNQNETFHVGLAKTLMDNRLHLSISNRYTVSSTPSEDFSIYSPEFMGTCKINHHHSFRLRAYVMHNKNKNDESKTFTEHTEDFSYVYTF